MDDAAIVVMLRRGDRSALGELSDRYRSLLVAAAGAILRDPGEAEDVAQEVLLRAPSAIDLVKEPSALRPYLESAARRLAIDRLRRRETGSRAALRAVRPGATPGSEESVMRAEEATRSVRELGRLREPYRSALTLRYLDGLAFPEIAARLGTNERTARTWVGRGLAELRGRMGG